MSVGDPIQTQPASVLDGVAAGTSPVMVYMYIYMYVSSPVVLYIALFYYYLCIILFYTLLILCMLRHNIIVNVVVCFRGL